MEILENKSTSQYLFLIASKNFCFNVSLMVTANWESWKAINWVDAI